MGATYFRLATDCFLVEGEKDGALYDVHGGHLHLLDREAHELLRRCERNVPLDGDLSSARFRFLQELRDAGLGFFSTKPTHVDKLLLHQPLDWQGMCMVPPRFFRVDLAITNRCDLQCPFCGRSDGGLVWQACRGCYRHDRGTRSAWSISRLVELVQEIAALEPRILHVRGGDPLAARESLDRVLTTARETPLECVVTTPGLARPVRDVVDLCRRTRAALNVVLFGASESDTRATCGTAGVFARQLRLLDTLAAEGIRFYLTFAVADRTRKRRSALRGYAQRRWQVEPSFAEVCRRETIRHGFRLSHVHRRTKPLSPWSCAEDFFFRVKNNSCLHGNFEIGVDGTIRSCAGIPATRARLGTRSLQACLSGDALYRLWEKGKDRVSPCRKCALRYACTDCSVFELAGESDPDVRTAYCPYDPRRGGPTAFGSSWHPTGFVRRLSPRSVQLTDRSDNSRAGTASSVSAALPAE